MSCIKIPGTPEGLPAIRRRSKKVSTSIITLLFAQSAYEKVAEAFPVRSRNSRRKGQDISHIASVASFFVSRIDTLIDGKIDEKLKPTSDAGQKALLESLRRQVKLCHCQRPGSLTRSIRNFSAAPPRWKALAAKVRRLSASSGPAPSTKNPKYRDVIYVEESDRRRHCRHDSASDL